MKTNENGITLASLVIAVVILAILTTVLVDLSLKDNATVDVMRRAQNVYVNQKSETQTRINEMTNGWEDILY